jgi:hypothetical protein
VHVLSSYLLRVNSLVETLVMQKVFQTLGQVKVFNNQYQMSLSHRCNAHRRSVFLISKIFLFFGEFPVHLPRRRVSFPSLSLFHLCVNDSSASLLRFLRLSSQDKCHARCTFSLIIALTYKSVVLILGFLFVYSLRLINLIYLSIHLSIALQPL